MSESAKRRCTPEWRTWQREQRITHLDSKLISVLYQLGKTQIEIASILGVSQKVIWRCMKINNIPTRIPIKRNQRGENNDYWKGGRVTDEAGYMLVKTPGHPRASQSGDYVGEHILVMEKYLGRYLIWHGPGDERSEIIHHKNRNKQDNRIDNLQVVNFREHMEIHSFLRKGGDAHV